MKIQKRTLQGILNHPYGGLGVIRPEDLVLHQNEEEKEGEKEEESVDGNKEDSGGKVGRRNERAARVRLKGSGHANHGTESG